MTQTSVVRAARKLIRENVAGLQTVADLQAVTPPIPPDECPAVLITFQRQPERPLAFGCNRVDGDMEIHLWRYDAEQSEENADSFDELLAAIADQLRAHPHFDGNADVAGKSQVLISGRQMTVTTTKPIFRNHVIRHGWIANRVTEIVTVPVNTPGA